MATPYVVSKIALTKSSSDFDRCNGEAGAISGCTADVPNLAENCRFSCSSWCPMCERNTTGQHDSLRKSLVDGLRKVDSGIHDSLKTLQPVTNKLNTQVITEKLSNLTQKANLLLSPPNDLVKNDLVTAQRPNSNGVHEKYVKEVEALKGKIQELRENLNRQFSESENIITAIPKLLWSKEPCVETRRGQHDEENSKPSRDQHEEKSSKPPESRRTKRLSHSETTPSPPTLVGQKRPRDFSPDINTIICDKPVTNVADSTSVVSNARPTKSSGSGKMSPTRRKSPIRRNRSGPSKEPCGTSTKTPTLGCSSPSTITRWHPMEAKEQTRSGKTSTRRNRNGPSTEPCGISAKTPPLGHNPFTITRWHPLETKEQTSTSPVSKLKEKNPLIGLENQVKVITPVSVPVVPPAPVSKTLPVAVSVRVDKRPESGLVKGTKPVGARKSLHPALRPSLFPNVPPYINFVNHDTQVDEPLPSPVSKVLKWKITTITPLVVRKTVVNSGFKLVKQTPEWTGTWGKHMKSVMFRTIKENQKINHFPGTFHIGRKDKLWKNLHHLMLFFSKREFGFIPRTYILPQDHKLLRIAWERDGGNDSTWIVKPPASARGTGIKVVNKWAQIPKKVPIIVQKYISNPYLINGNKFDLRLYALVTSFNPLKIYLYDNGLVRFASVKYSEDLSSLSDRYMHLTNYSINKLSNNYHHNEDADACQGHKWTIKTLFTYLQEKVDVKALWERLVDLVIKTMMCGEMSICNLSTSNITSHYCCYELFGVDVLLDENLTPWLLEVNISPSLHSASPLDLAVKGPLIRDILNIAGYQIPDMLTDSLKSELKSKLGLKESDAICYNKDLYIAGLSDLEKKKQNTFVTIERSEYLDEILKVLTPDDIRHLIRYEDELTQIGSFEKIFPTAESHEYLKYFESPQYYNKLFDAWESKYGTNRDDGVEYLRKLCEVGLHLDTTNVVLHVSPSVNDLTESESSLPSDPSETSQKRSTVGASNALKVLRKRRKMNFGGRPYTRFNKTPVRRPRST